MVGKIDFDNWEQEGKPSSDITGSYYKTVLDNLEELSKGDNSKLNNPFENNRLPRERQVVKPYVPPVNPFSKHNIEEEQVVSENTLSEEEYNEKASDIAEKLFGKGTVEVKTLATKEVIEENEPVKDFTETVADIILETIETGEISKDFDKLYDNNIKQEFIDKVEALPHDSRYEITSDVLLEFLKHKPKITMNQLDRFTKIYSDVRPYNKLRRRVDDNIKINKYLKTIKININLTV